MFNLFFLCACLAVFVISPSKKNDFDTLDRQMLLGTYPVECKQCNLQNRGLALTDLHDAHFEGADMSETNFFAADLHGACLDNANLSRVRMGRVNLRNASLRNAILDGAYLGRADLTGADLTGVHAEYTNFEYASFEHARIVNADLDHADITYAHFNNAYLKDNSYKKALMWGALMPNGTVIAQPGFVTWVMSLLWRKQPKGDEL